jgi:hypothetical protein
MIAYTCSRWVRLAILPDRVPDKPWLGTPLERENDEVSGGARLVSSRRPRARDEEGEVRELTGR